MENLRLLSISLLGILFLSGCANQMDETSYASFYSSNSQYSNQYSTYSAEMQAQSQLPNFRGQAAFSAAYNEGQYAARMPQTVNYGKEKVILVDPARFAWGAYDENGQLVRAGIASAGADYCADDNGPCRTHTGSFRISSMGDEGCVSKKYPIGKGGSLMPFCMFFSGGQSLHGAPDGMMREAHLSHGCIRMRIPAAEWIRYNFAEVGTKVVVLPY